MTPEPIPRRAWAALLVGSATVVLVILDAGFVALAFPDLADRFADTSRATLGWVFTGYFIALAAFMLLAGWIADRVGRRRVFFVGLAVFAGGAVATGLSMTPTALIVARVVQGIGAAALTPVSLAMVLPLFPVGRRATAVGGWAVAGALAGVVSPTLGAVLVEAAGWRAPFFFFAPVCLLAWLIGREVLPDDATERGAAFDDRPVDLVGVGTTTVVVAAAAVAVTQGDDWGWASPSTLAAFGIVAVGGPFLVRRARHDPHALLDVEVFSVRSFTTSTVVSVLSQAGFFAFFLSIPLFLVDVWGWTALEAGFAVAVNQAASAVVGLPAGRRADRSGPVGVIVVGGAIAAVGYAWLAIGASEDPELWTVLVPSFVVAGIGSMMVGGTISAAAFRDIADDALGRAAAAYYVTRRLGSAAGGVAAVAVLGDRTGVDALPGFRGVWWFTVGCYLAAAVAMAVGFRGSGSPAR